MGDTLQPETVPAGYFESLAKLQSPRSWDVQGLIEDARTICKREDECTIGMGHVLAVIDHLQKQVAIKNRLRVDVSQWVQLAKYQREWFEKHHEAGKDAGPCPTDAAIRESERLLYSAIEPLFGEGGK